MLSFGRAARLILVATVPALAMAQTPQIHPASPQQRPAASSPASTAPAPAARPQPPAAPSSQRFVTSENFFHARPKPQPSSNAAPTDAANSASQPATVRNTPALQPRPTMPASAQPPAIAAASALSTPQPSAATAVPNTPSPVGSGHQGAAAVDYSQGQLTVVSQNAPLGLVLKLVAAKTGAVIDLAPELQNEPVIAQLGPGPGREVMTGLLDSPRIDYIIMEKGDEAGNIQRIIVRTRHAFARVAMAAIHQPQPKQEDLEEETKVDANGHMANGLTPPEAKMTQQQLMENWKKVREEKRLAEIQQQEQDRENEKTQVEPTPQPQSEPQPDNPPQR